MVLLFLTATAFAWAYLTGYSFTMPIEAAVRAETMESASPEKIDQLVLAALERDDIEDADMYVEVASFLDYELPESTLSKLNDAHSLSATVVRNTYQFGEGFVTGKGDSNAGLAGAVTSDLTVIGDIRDIAAEGTKMLAGQDYSELILGLSVIGVGVTAATIATGGGGIIAKAGISLVKAARRTGHLTSEFATVLTRMSNEAVNMPLLRQTLRGVDLTDLTRTERVLTDYSKNVKAAKILPLLSRLGEINAKVGPAETIRIMRFVKTGEHLDDVAVMTKRFGLKSRGIMELTGKFALRSFKTSFRLVEWFAKSASALVLWVGGLVVMSLMRNVRLTPRRRKRQNADA
jgi:hypothetical protein